MRAVRTLVFGALLTLAGCVEEADFSGEGQDAAPDATTPAPRDRDAAPRPGPDAEREGDAAPPLPDAARRAPDAAPDAAAPAPDAAPIVGRWLSQGEDVAPLLSGPPASIVRIDTTFGADGAYAVVSTNDDQQTVRFEGTYSVDPATDPARIVLRQAAPQAVRSEGLVRVAGGVLTLEIAQTEPPLNGVSPPAADEGFGSTSGGAFGRDNVQIFRAVR